MATESIHIGGTSLRVANTATTTHMCLLKRRDTASFKGLGDAVVLSLVGDFPGAIFTTLDDFDVKSKLGGAEVRGSLVHYVEPVEQVNCQSYQTQ